MESRRPLARLQLGADHRVDHLLERGQVVDDERRRGAGDHRGARGDWVASGTQLAFALYVASARDVRRGAGSASGWRPSRQVAGDDDLGLGEVLAVAEVVVLLEVVGEIDGDRVPASSAKSSAKSSPSWWAPGTTSTISQRPSASWASAPVRSPPAPSTRVVETQRHGERRTEHPLGQPGVPSSGPGRAWPARPRARRGTGASRPSRTMWRRGACRPPRGRSTPSPARSDRAGSGRRASPRPAVASGSRGRRRTCARVDPASPTQSTQSRTSDESWVTARAK